MADSAPQGHDKIEVKVAPSQTPPDLYSFLITAIETASRDPAQLRNFVYAMVWQSLKAESELTRRQPVELGPSQKIYELQKALEFKRAIERVEAGATHTEGANPAARPDHELQRVFEQTKAAPVQQPHEAASLQTHDAMSIRKPVLDHGNVPATQVSDSTSLVVFPERIPDELQPANTIIAHRPPPWLSQSVHVSVQMAHSARDELPYWGKTSLLPFLQLVAASVIGVALYAGISGWMLSRPQPASGPISTVAPSPAHPMETSPIENGASNQSWAPPLPPQRQAHGQPPPQANPRLPQLSFRFLCQRHTGSTPAARGSSQNWQRCRSKFRMPGSGSPRRSKRPARPSSPAAS